MFIIVEKEDVGGRDTVIRHLVATESVYGGEPLPAHKTKASATECIANRDDSYRNFEIFELKET